MAAQTLAFVERFANKQEQVSFPGKVLP